MLSAENILAAWERGRHCTAARRAVQLLEGAGVADGASVSVAERNALLLRVWRKTFGDAIEAIVECPVCGLTMEFRASAKEMVEAIEQQEGSGRSSAAPEWAQGAVRARFRHPSALDLAEASEAGEAGEVLRSLRRRAVGEIRRGHSPAQVAELDDQETETLDAALAAFLAADELAVTLRCDQCGHAWSPVLDLPSLLWEELEATAQALLREVHLLASAYGWSEREILELGPARRARYLELLQGDRA